MFLTRRQLRNIIKEEITMRNMQTDYSDPMDLISSMDDKLRVISYYDHNSDQEKPVVIICQRLKPKYKDKKTVPEDEYENAWEDLFQNNYASEEDAEHDLRQVAMQMQRMSFANNPKFSKEEE